MPAIFWVTTRCNLNCKYCYEGKNKYEKSMSKDVVDRAIEYTLDYFKDRETDKKELIVPIHGGEPFLEFGTIKYVVKKFREQCDKKSTKLLFCTTTNGTLLNDEMIDFIVKEMIDVTVSIDGTKKTHDKMRPFKSGEGSHDIVLKNVYKLIKYKPNIRIRMTFDSDTVCSLFEDIKYLIDRGFKVIVPAPNLFDPNWDDEHVAILEDQIRKIKEYANGRKDLLISIIDGNLYFPKGYCRGGDTSFHIYPDGKIYPCILSAGNDEFCIGDIYNGINELKRDYLLGFSKIRNPDCYGCKLYNYCDGPRCKIVNKIITGDYFSSPPMNCALENLQYKINLLNK